MTAMKITDAASIGGNCTVQYPTRSAINCDGSKILILEPGHFALYDGLTLKRIESLEWLGDANEPLWSRSDPNIFYYHSANVILSYSISGYAIHSERGKFPEYDSITFGGESDISADEEHIAIVGTKPDGSREAFVYRISTDSKSKAVAIDANFDACLLTPGNNLLLSYPQGVFTFNPVDDSVRKLTNANGHKAVTRFNGQEYMIWANSNENPVTLAAYPNGIVMVRLADGRQAGLLSLDWSLAVHISSPRDSGFALVSTYDPKNPDSTVPHANAILKVPLDGSINGSKVTTILKHGSDSANYDGQPRASVGAKGERFLYNSNVRGLTDVYLGVLGSVVDNLPADGAASEASVPVRQITLRSFPNQGPLTMDNFPAKPHEMGTVFDGTRRWLIENDGGNKWKMPWEQVTD